MINDKDLSIGQLSAIRPQDKQLNRVYINPDQVKDFISFGYKIQYYSLRKVDPSKAMGIWKNYTHTEKGIMLQNSNVVDIILDLNEKNEKLMGSLVCANDNRKVN